MIGCELGCLGSRGTQIVRICFIRFQKHDMVMRSKFTPLGHWKYYSAYDATFPQLQCKQERWNVIIWPTPVWPVWLLQPYYTRLGGVSSQIHSFHLCQISCMAVYLIYTSHLLWEIPEETLIFLVNYLYILNAFLSVAGFQWLGSDWFRWVPIYSSPFHWYSSLISDFVYYQKKTCFHE